MKLLRTLTLSAAAIVASAGMSSATVYEWTWTPDSGVGSYSDQGGDINWITSSFDSSTNKLTWYTNMMVQSSRMGFTLAINDGPNPNGLEGEMALIYFDAKNNTPELSVYGYNGRNDHTSYKDGTRYGSNYDNPDRILTSKYNSSSYGSWLHDKTKRWENDGSLTMGFSIDATSIINHNPMYTDGSAWKGIGYGDDIGVWFHTFSNLNRRYYGSSSSKAGFLKDWGFSKQGWLDLTYGSTSPTDPVPEPASLLLLGGGLGLGAIVRRRKNAAK